MISNVLKALGVVLALVITVAVCLATMYLSYILGIAIVLMAVFFIAYHAVKTLQTPKKQSK